MQSIIAQRIMPGTNEVDNRIVLSNTNIARQHGFGSSWKGLRLVLRYSMTTANKTDITGSPFFAMGFCSGNVDGSLLFDSTTQHFVGIYSTGVSYTFRLNNLNGNGATPAYLATYSFGKKIGTTFSTLTATSTTAVISASAGIRARNLIVVDIVKGAPNYTMNSYWQNMNDLTSGNPADGFGDPSAQDLFNSIEQNAPTYHSTYYLSQSSPIAVDEAANGALDNIIVAWSDTLNTYEISDIYVGRLS